MYQEPYVLTPDAIVVAAREWRTLHGRGPVLQGRAAAEYREMAGKQFYQTFSPSPIFAEDLVRDTIAEVFRYEYPATKLASGELISIQVQGHRGQTSFGWNTLNRTGNDVGSAIVSEQANDVRSVTIVGEQQTQQVATLARAFDWTIQDFDAAEMQGAFDLVQEKARATREQLDTDFDDLIADGRASSDGSTVIWPGLFQYPGRLTATRVNGDWDNPSTTPLEKIADVAEGWRTAFTSTQGVMLPDTVLFSLDLWPRLREPLDVEFAHASTLDLLKRTYPEITRWDFERHLPSGSMFMYQNKSHRVAVRAPVRWEFLPPEARGMSFRTIVRNRFGGVYSPHPTSMLLMTSLNTAI